MPLFTAPLFAVVFFAIVRNAGRDDLDAYAVVAPTVLALWWLALIQAGDIINADRWLGVIEITIAAPANFTLLVLGRVLAVTLLGLVSFFEVWVIARWLFDVKIQVFHEWILATTLAATAFAMASTSVVIAAIFVLTRTGTTLLNSLTWPFYVFGGVLVPTTFLPQWLEPVSFAFFLSWTSDLLRASLSPAAVENPLFRVAMIFVLGVGGLLLGKTMLDRVIRRVLQSGTLSHT